MNFDFVARPYRLLERIAFGRALEKCRTALLPVIPPPRRALSIGEGDGRFLAAFVRTFPDTEVDVLERSGDMIQLARKRVGPTPNVRFRREDALAASLTEAYDLVITHFVLDVLTEPEVRFLVEKIQRVAPQGQWLVSEFQVAKGRWPARVASSVAITGMYTFFRAVAGLEVNTIPDYRAVFRSLGMQPLAKREAWAGFLSSELWRIRPS